MAELEKQLRDLDMAVGQDRIYLLSFHHTLASALALAEGNIEILRQLASKKKPRLVELPKIQ